MRVIIFDDSEMVRTVLADLLRQYGHEVHTYAGPRTSPFFPQCPCSPEQWCTDVIITDQNMPCMTGVEFIHHQHQHTCRVPLERIALFSGEITSVERAHAQNLGFRTFEKPQDLLRLVDWVNSLPDSPAPR